MMQKTLSHTTPGVIVSNLETITEISICKHKHFARAHSPIRPPSPKKRTSNPMSWWEVDQFCPPYSTLDWVTVVLRPPAVLMTVTRLMFSDRCMGTPSILVCWPGSWREREYKPETHEWSGVRGWLLQRGAPLPPLPPLLPKLEEAAAAYARQSRMAR